MPIINGVEVEGCEFQKECIEYKDISYLKDMPICAVFSMSVACHDKVNKCKYYSLYKQLQRVKAENEKLTKQRDILLGQLVINDGEDVTVQISLSQFDEYNELQAENQLLRQTLKNKNFVAIVEENEKLEQENKELTHYLACMTEQRNKANTTLQKIKAICKMDCGDCQYHQECDCNYSECEEAKIDDILTLIKKAEEQCQ